MKTYLLAAAAAAALAATPAVARDHSAYFGIEAGPMAARDSHVNVDNPLIVGDADFDIDHKLGVDGDLIAGYDFGMFRAEVEGAYKWAKHDEYSDIFGDHRATGHSRAYSLMANAMIDVGRDETVNFYAGAGAGIAWVNQRIDLPDAEGFSISDNKFAWQLIAGVRAPVFRHFDVGLKYRYFDAGRIKDDHDFGIAAPNIVDLRSRRVMSPPAQSATLAGRCRRRRARLSVAWRTGNAPENESATMSTPCATAARRTSSSGVCGPSDTQCAPSGTSSASTIRRPSACCSEGSVVSSTRG